MSKSLKSLKEELTAIDCKNIIHPQSNPKAQIENGPKIIFKEGEGIYLKDIDGRSYLDGVSMLWNVNLGHGNKELAEASYQQMTQAAYTTTFYGYINEATARLAEKITSLTPGDLNTIFFTSGGSESNDTAFKLSRFYWQLKGYKEKRKIISLKRGYHGVTIAAQRATGIDAFRDFSGVIEQDIVNAKPHLTECELGDSSHPEYEGSIRSIIEKEGADKIAAIIIEPIQGAGGVHIPPQGYLQAVRQLCDENNIHFIADEVICGFGRTGKMFGVEHWEVVPDFMSVAKGITSGYAQLGGVIMTEEIRDTLNQYDNMLPHGFTYSGHPAACAVGLKNIEIIERDNLVKNAHLMGEELNKGFHYLEDKHSIFKNTRNRGLLAGVDIIKDRDTNTPFEDSAKAASKFIDECYQRDLLIRAFDFEPGMNIVAVAPPLVITKEEIENIINIMDDAAVAFSRKML
ncbi:aspartate aminotransferase family protein [Oceanobacillus oncorhynchi subsp. incaldanensis]|uniref:aminotransferase family protein n=1 Tax=Oceanobacillus oncorhynchi TaxID=545501 RepID=UPI001B1990AA|nr:aspartate aminotransferase family protein [Oceanobacillus oncorhynchi subsp. incaldanensis]